MIYLDASSLVKVIRYEPESDAVAECIDREREVVVSALAELEATIDLKATYLAGACSLSQWRRSEARLIALRNEEPFSFKTVPTGIWTVAFRQHRNSGKLHCRTLDRLHLAAAEQLGITRLMTSDEAQGKAAEALGWEVVRPGRA